jgi:hypothetical protein
MLQTKVVENTSKHKVYVQLLAFENRVVYEIMWKNTVDPGRPHRTI